MFRADHVSRAVGVTLRVRHLPPRARRKGRRLACLAPALLALASPLHDHAVMSSSWSLALVGGTVIGGASALLLLAHGRVAGISGIAGSLVAPVEDRAWRVAFLLGLALAGLVARGLAPGAIGGPVASLPVALLAGLLVGVGTRLGGGCTSGHGVCGLARRSGRSLIAVLTFMTTGVLTAVLAGAAS
jgi:uncharacterized membrane protein YedE/YeeE